jgi:hypothetical protein
MCGHRQEVAAMKYPKAISALAICLAPAFSYGAVSSSDINSQADIMQMLVAELQYCGYRRNVAYWEVAGRLEGEFLKFLDDAGYEIAPYMEKHSLKIAVLRDFRMESKTAPTAAWCEERKKQALQKPSRYRELLSSKG